MKAWTVWACAVGMLAAAGALAAKKGQFEANRAGWMLGMYVGEENGKPYPFVLDIEKKSEAASKGIRVGDEILKLDGVEGRPLKKLHEHATGLRSGRLIEVWLRRGSQTLMVEMRVPKPPAAEEVEAPRKGGESAEGEKDAKKKEKKKRPIVFKPIPPPEEGK